MMGRQTGDQSQLFYLFNLEKRIPAGTLLRRVNSADVLAGERARDRTEDLLIKSQLLYRLSYALFSYRPRARRTL